MISLFWLIILLIVMLDLFCILEAKEQVLANLANFAYDPINYEYMRALKIPDLFLGLYNAMLYNKSVHVRVC